MPKYKILPIEPIFDKLTKSLSTIRSGRVNSSILEYITVPVPAWGGEFKISELATVTNPLPSQLVITPFDKGVVSAIEKAVLASSLGVNPVNDGAGIKLNFPPMTEEERKKKGKVVSEFGEQAKVTVRMVRKDLIQTKKAQKEKGEITEDELRFFETDLQKDIDNANKEIDAIVLSKQEELMKI
jgi:ribosome recycling factor